MKHLVVFPIFLGLLLAGNHPAFALSSRSVFEGDVNQGIDLKVWPGYGLTINLLPTHAIIKQAWLGHPGRFLLSSNGSLCPQSFTSQGQSCKNVGASVLFLRLIDPKASNIPDLPSSIDGSTQVTLIVQKANGDEQELQFGLLPAQGKPEYTSLRIYPDSEKPKPILPLAPIKQNPIVPRITSPGLQQPSHQQVSLKPVAGDEVRDQEKIDHLVLPLTSPVLPLATTDDRTPPPLIPNQSTPLINFQSADSNLLPSTETTKNQPQPTENTTAFAFGLLAGIQTGKIQPGTPVWEQTQNTLSRLRQGQSIEDALNGSKLSRLIFNYFVTLGQQKTLATNYTQRDTVNTAPTPPISITPPQTSPELTAIPTKFNSSVVNLSTSSPNSDFSQLQLSSPQSSSVNYAKLAVLGIISAKNRGQIKINSPQWHQIQKVIVNLRQGVALKTALLDAKLESFDFEQLIDLGQEYLKVNCLGTIGKLPTTTGVEA